MSEETIEAVFTCPECEGTLMVGAHYGDCQRCNRKGVVPGSDPMLGLLTRMLFKGQWKARGGYDVWVPDP